MRLANLFVGGSSPWHAQHLYCRANRSQREIENINGTHMTGSRCAEMQLVG
ncbi:uncharacterized protein PHALS_08396 [Plasmopara halstedii]|uniref:Uncharacterized protein n=1 Tax=Plasmopara halstedii TaxID=4781 RepID=A0A0N7L4C8_PLAHL|nr:uncharacterized protein PHALS_08396 [Plasmopara halstedii]CEG38315.1 hypothetical protein PHALS_08396 [Plasmopara halstedii]|eukprot:XP_024574684.1 hypothetical protein PHALS_08396 [Plasmopara halstedii]